MKSIILLLIFYFSYFGFTIEKTAYYNALSSDSIEKLDSMIQQLEKEKATPLNLAYKGTIIAKKASFVKSASEKMKLFKTGVQLLEKEISRSPNEIEYRFLRLTIQENSPKFLKYNKNIEEDMAVITKGFANLSKELKKIILDYALESKVLKSSELK